MRFHGVLTVAIFDHVVVPIATSEDARATAGALEPFLDDVEHVTAVHVIEKGSGAIDKAPMEKRRGDATEFLALFEAELGDGVSVATRIEYGTDVVDTVLETAIDAGGSCVAFRPRGGGRIIRLLTGDTATRLVADPDVPVVSLPGRTEGG